MAATTGTVGFRRVPAGSYRIMVDAHSPGDEGTVELRLDVR
jgi:hypothetical protein